MIKPGLCVGLDTQDYKKIINTVKADVFKVNPAFNPDSTKDIAKLLNDRNIPWIYDAKLGDVMHTNAYYAKYVFKELGASGVTLNPFVGLEALQPFFEYKDRMNFLLCNTTNPGKKLAQDAIYDQVVEFAEMYDNIGIVHSSKNMPKTSSLILCPGIGKQGGNIRPKHNVLYSVSRSIVHSYDPKAVSIKYYNNVHKNIMFSKLVKENYIKYGRFTLSSGIKSDYYIDLKEISKDISLFSCIVNQLSELVNTDSILGMESGSISLATGIAMQNQIGFGFIRKQVKAYATKKLIEGNVTGSITLVDDVLTTGKTILSALDSLPDYNITDVVVVAERGEVGRKALEAKGIEVKSLFKLP